MARKLPILTDEQLKAWRTAMNEEMEKRLKMMRERQAYFSAVAEEYESFEEFTKTQKIWLEIMGIELIKRIRHICLFVFSSISKTMKHIIS